MPSYDPRDIALRLDPIQTRTFLDELAAAVDEDDRRKLIAAWGVVVRDLSVAYV